MLDKLNGFYGRFSCSIEKLIIPESFNGYPITEIGPAALQDPPNLTSLIILAPITKIHENGIRNLILKTLVLPPTLTTIGDSAVYHFPNLEKIIFPFGTNLTYIGSWFLGAIFSTAVSIYFCGNLFVTTANDPFFITNATITVYVPVNGPSSFFGRNTKTMNSSNIGFCYLSYYNQQKCRTLNHNYVCNFYSIMKYLYSILLS